ncbi:lysozyme [Hydrocarboniphaga effusa]|uniref:lysozyme n=1 Tax=Hydrocarboniphaga effusa TaxID=243629 RepID=UPI003BA960B3
MDTQPTSSARKRLAIAVGGATAALLVAIVPKWEGTVLKGYRDPIGIVTACTGHTATAKLGKTYTKVECEELLVDDLIAHSADVDRCVKVPLKPHQRAAFVSFAFNVGGQKFCASTLVRKLNAGDYAGACAELSRWTKAGGIVLRGLVERRREERALCEGLTS